MRRFGALMLCGALAGFAAGCDGEDQPNAAATPDQVDEDFLKKSSEMMKEATAGLNKKNQKSSKSKAAAAPAPGDATPNE